jgi:ubiquinone/menaquinone biosynthesis C-methylase UbiE
VIEPSLQAESGKLARSWMQHDAGMLRDYLVAGVEDPRLNVQSILSRHFLARALTANRFSALMEADYRFAAAMNWLTALAGRPGDAGELESVLHALRRRADNAEGIEIPAFILRTFAALPATAGGIAIPNYIESFLSGTQMASDQVRLHEPSLNTFRDLWRIALEARIVSVSGMCESAVPAAGDGGSMPTAGKPDGAPAGGNVRATLSVLEPACGSANDYRFLHAYGLARLVDYTGFDLCAKNVENACALFPGVRFAIGNVFEIAAPDKAYDLCFVHDLFEHLSLEGMQAAVKEVCRVTRQGLCVGFFNMDEVRDHQVRPMDEYHWNLLSMARMKELFAECGFAARVVHIGVFLRQQIGCEQTHNQNAYTFLLRPAQAF